MNFAESEHLRCRTAGVVANKCKGGMRIGQPALAIIGNGTAETERERNRNTWTEFTTCRTKYRIECKICLTVFQTPSRLCISSSFSNQYSADFE